MKKPRIQLVWL